MRELYFLAEEDIDLSDKTWYYALSLEFILDAGVVLDSYETFHNYYEKCVGKKHITIRKAALKCIQRIYPLFVILYALF